MVEQEQAKQALEVKTDRAKHFLEILLNQQEIYHNHKETMAHAGVLVQIAIAAGILTKEDWPPVWLDYNYYPAVFTTVGIILIWLLVHIFIRWQLRNRRGAALMYAAILRTLRFWVHTDPIEEDLKPYTPANKRPSVLVILIDYLIYSKCNNLHNPPAITAYS